MIEKQQKPACAEQYYEVKMNELPLSCPTDSMVLWNAHPKIYLPITETGEEVCPYCGTHFILKND